MSEPVALPNKKCGYGEFLGTENEVRFNTHRPAPGVTLDDMLHPVYWAHVAQFMKVDGEITVIPPDRSWRARLVVDAVEPQAARVHLDHLWTRAATTVATDTVLADLEIEHRGKAGWRVKRKSDGATVKDGLESKDHAEIFVAHYAKKLAA